MVPLTVNSVRQSILLLKSQRRLGGNTGLNAHALHVAESVSIPGTTWSTTITRCNPGHPEHHWAGLSKSCRAGAAPHPRALHWPMRSGQQRITWKGPLVSISTLGSPSSKWKYILNKTSKTTKWVIRLSISSTVTGLKNRSMYHFFIHAPNYLRKIM